MSKRILNKEQYGLKRRNERCSSRPCDTSPRGRNLFDVDGTPGSSRIVTAGPWAASSERSIATPLCRQEPDCCSLRTSAEPGAPPPLLPLQGSVEQSYEPVCSLRRKPGKSAVNQACSILDILEGRETSKAKTDRSIALRNSQTNCT